MTKTIIASLAALAVTLSVPAGESAFASQPGAGPVVAAKDAEGVDLPSKSRKDRKKNQDKSSQAAGKKEDPKFEDVVKDARKIDGLFTVYEKDGKFLLALKPDQLDKDFMVSVTRETGIGQTFILATMVLGENPVRFHRVGDRVQALMVNTRFTAQDDPEIRRAVERSFSSSLLGSSKVEGQPHPDSKAILVDLAPYFLNDVEGLQLFMMNAFKAQYGLDRENSYVSGMKGFPKNLEVEARIHFDGKKPVNFVNLPDPRSFFINYRYSVTEVPEAPGYVPRLADDRVGHFMTLYQDFSDDRRDSPYVRYITRWNLEKEEPYAEISRPKEPITFWLENSIPKQYRKAVADGILLWNDAFEKIGFKDALVVKQQPDESEWDPADARYSTVRWFVTTTSSFAIGPSRINPKTGQIYDADIGVSEAIVRVTRREFQELTDPVSMVNEMARSMQPLPEPDDLTAGIDPRLLCGFGYGGAQQAAFGHAVLTAQGMEPGSPAEEKYINDFIVHVMAHEVGHTLGFMHNFRASTINTVEEVQNPELTQKRGLTGSVMDYTPVNLAAASGRQVQHWQTSLGPYDYWAVEYAYSQFPDVKKPEDEIDRLKPIAAKVGQPGLQFGTHEDMSDPDTNMWDIGSDDLAYYRQRIELARELWRRIPQKMAEDGEGYQVFRRAFSQGILEYVPAALNVVKQIGGMHLYREHVGDTPGRLPFVPVPAARQREALEFLRVSIFSADAFRLPPDLLNRLAASRWWDFEFSIFQMPRIEFPLHDVVLNIQSIVLNSLYSPVKLDRLVDLEMHVPRDQKPFTLAEMFAGVQESVWSEVHGSGTPRIDSFRRGLQRAHLNRLIELVVKPADGVPEDAITMARANLVDLVSRIDAALKGGSLDVTTRAHLEETRARAAAALEAGMLRPIAS